MVFKNPVLRSSALYFLLSIVAFFPCLFLKMAYFDDDLIQAYYFFQKFLRDGIAQGHLHFWNPFLVGGQPFLADANAMAFYPLLYPTLLFQPPVGYGIFCSIHLMLALCGMHYWLRKLDFSERASLVGSLAFGFSGFFWTELVHPLVLADFALIPWFLGALENLIQTPRPSRVFWAGLIFALMFLAGQFQIILCVLCVSPIYALYRAGLSDEWKSLKGGDALLKLFLIVTLFAFASFPMWLMWIPVHEYFSQSARYHAVLDYKTFNAGLSLEFSRLYQFLFPDHPSVYSQSSQLNFQLFQANEGFIGIWMPLFLFWALRKPVRKVTYFSMMAALVFLLIAFGQNFPLHAALCRWVPRFGLMRAPIRYLFVYATFMPVLITAGCEVVFQKLDCGDQHSFLPDFGLRRGSRRDGTVLI